MWACAGIDPPVSQQRGAQQMLGTQKRLFDDDWLSLTQELPAVVATRTEVSSSCWACASADDKPGGCAQLPGFRKR